MLSERDVEKARRVNAEIADELGDAKERLILSERRTKRIIALEKKKFADKPAHVQDREAYASEAYEQASVEEAKAAGVWEYVKAKGDHAKLTIEIWRTLEANHRAAAH